MNGTLKAFLIALTLSLFLLFFCKSIGCNVVLYSIILSFVVFSVSYFLIKLKS